MNMRFLKSKKPYVYFYSSLKKKMDYNLQLLYNGSKERIQGEAMKKFVLIISLIMAMSLQIVAAHQNIFFDVSEKHWGYKDILTAYKEGVVNGMGVDQDTGKIIFKPDGELTAAQFITVLGKSFYPNDMKQYAKDGGQWYAPAFRLANNHNLLRNTDLYENFQRKINRYEFAQILYNIIEDFSYEIPSSEELNAIQAKIGDYKKVRSSGYDKAVLVCTYYGLVSGVDSRGTFYGEKNLTRAQLTAFYVKSKPFRGALMGQKSFDKKLVNKSTDNQKNKNVQNANQTDNKGSANKASKSSEYKNEVLRLVNIERESRNIEPLQGHAKLEELAQLRSDELLIAYGHERPDKRSCFSILDDNGVRYFSCGENIAAGYRTPEEVVKGWMNSKGHRENILNPDYLYMGVGYSSGLGKGTEYEDYWVQLFLRQ